MHNYNTIVALTGASGFIGNAIAQALSTHGFRVRALVRNPSKAIRLAEQNIELVKGDLANPTVLAHLVDGVSAVIHCAGCVRGATAEPFNTANVDGCNHLLDAIAQQATPPRVLYFSSLAASQPQLSNYAVSKWRSEQLLAQYDLPVTTVRPPAVYGPGDRELLPLFRLMAKGLVLLPGSINARFSLIYIDDLVNAAMVWLQTQQPRPGVYSIEDGHGGYSWPEMAAIVSGITQRKTRILSIPHWLLGSIAYCNQQLARWIGYAPMLTPGKLRELRHPDWVCGNSFSEHYAWQPQVQLDQGLRNMSDWL